jgi:3-oxoadipate enol-lactonase
VLLSNSLGSTLDLWSAQVGAWSSSYRVVRYDTRGHGQSSSPAGEYTIDDLGQDAVRVLDALGIRRAHVCGISLGGLTAMWLGAQRPDRVASLVIANTAARVGTPQRWVDRAAKVRDEGMTAIADLAMSTWFTPAFREREPATIARFHRMVASTDPDGYIGCCAALRDADVRPDLGRVAARSLVIAGSHDTTTTVADAEAIRDAIAGATLVTLPAAHLTNVESAAEFSRSVSEVFRG